MRGRKKMLDLRPLGLLLVVVAGCSSRDAVPSSAPLHWDASEAEEPDAGADEDGDGDASLPDGGIDEDGDGDASLLPDGGIPPAQVGAGARRKTL
jgi:hypothetical protein